MSNLPLSWLFGDMVATVGCLVEWKLLNYRFLIHRVVWLFNFLKLIGVCKGVRYLCLWHYYWHSEEIKFILYWPYDKARVQAASPHQRWDWCWMKLRVVRGKAVQGRQRIYGTQGPWLTIQASKRVWAGWQAASREEASVHWSLTILNHEHGRLMAPNPHPRQAQMAPRITFDPLGHTGESVFLRPRPRKLRRGSTAATTV